MLPEKWRPEVLYLTAFSLKGSIFPALEKQGIYGTCFALCNGSNGEVR